MTTATTLAQITWFHDYGGALDASWLARLPAAEQQQFHELGPQRQRGFVLTRLLLRQLLSDHLPAEDIRFERAANGRLRLAGDTGWHISLSHAEGGCAVIVATAPCGIDIEKQRTVGMEKIAARHFDPREVAQLQAAAPAEREALFFRLWTLKEASVKALGEGLANNMGRLAFDVSSTDPWLLAGPPSLQLWQQQEGAFHLSACVITETDMTWQITTVKIAD